MATTSVEAGLCNELFRLRRVGKMGIHFVRPAVYSVNLHAAEAAQFAFYRYAEDGHIQQLAVTYFVHRCWGLAVFCKEPSIITEVNPTRWLLLSGCCHGQDAWRRDMGPFDCRFHEFLEINHLAVLQGAAACLDDDRAVGIIGGLHDGLNLFHVVDIKGTDAIAALCGFVQNLSHWY